MPTRGLPPSAISEATMQLNKPHFDPNPVLCIISGIGLDDLKNKVFAKRGLYKGQKKTQKPAAEAPAERAASPPKPSGLRSSITPGTVVILLAGRFRGKRVVFLKQLESGLLLVTGPYKVNGVPLRRVNQAYVIATSTKIDISGVKVDEKVNDAYFAKSSSSAGKSAELEFFEDGKPKAKEAFPESKAADQKEVDKAVIEAIKKTEYLAKYLKASWGLSKGQFPHQLVF
ncbi:hypothetical protein H1R20_g389, partial [Candolleomyces eurysporus]